MAVGRSKKALKWVDTIKKGYTALAGKDLARAVSARATEAATPAYKKGGVVRTTGRALVHKNELVITAAQRKVLKRILK